MKKCLTSINKNKLTVALLALCLAACAAFAIGAPQAYASQAQKLGFAAVSDLHIDDLLNQTKISNRVQFQAVVNSVKDSNLDAFIVGGDMSSYGNTAE